MSFTNAKDQALFLYGFDISASNCKIPFKITSMGSELNATLSFGNYTATTFAAEVKRALGAADGSNTYSVSVSRNVSGGNSNSFTIATSGSFLSLLFSSGTTAATCPTVLMGFPVADQTGHTSYSSPSNCGTILIPDFPTYNYHGPSDFRTNDGIKNVSASGIKETIVFAQMAFFEGTWQWITDLNGSTQKTQWEAFMQYATKQLQLEFQPSIYEDPTVFYQCTLESTPEDVTNGMAYKLKQMTSVGLYRFYQTGTLKFRQNPS